MRAQVQIRLLLVGFSVFALASATRGEGNAEEAYRRGEFLQALKGVQAETTAELTSRGKVPAKQEWADSGTWEVESANGLKSLCLFEKGVQAWVKGDAPAAVRCWTESQKEALGDPAEKRAYFRRTQLALLMTQWGQLDNSAQKAEAVFKVAADIQALPLPENTPDLRHQIRAEQVLGAMGRYLRLTSRVGDATFPQVLIETWRDIRKEQQVGQLLCTNPGREEPTYDALVDRVLFENLREPFWRFMDEYLAAQPQARALVGNVKGPLELLRLFAAMEAPKGEVFIQRLGKWVEGPPPPAPALVNAVLLEFLRGASESNQPEVMERVVKGCGPHLSKVTWPNDAVCSRVAQLFQSRGDYARAASLAGPVVAKTSDPQAQAHGLVALMEVKLKAGDSSGALADGMKALATLDKSAPARLHRLLATACINLKKYPEAVTHLQNYLDKVGKTPETVEAQYLIGWLYSLDRKFDQARTQFQGLVDTYPDSPFAKKSRDFLVALPPAPTK